ncbi:TPM domain-containing protein [Caulobacter rhizosphaerae]|uniref:TPM domain-containing protein n=1 Tax=Caulobacter rhizosphaerae TaxID=2010972 RepID=UPI00286C1BDA|nr:TPM domain-containing protein [Caulobacter rhizosphaerae]
MRGAVGGLLAAVAVLFALPALAAGPTFPALSGRVVDSANILSPAVEAELTTKLESLEKTTGRQLVVATVPSLQGYEIEDYGYQLGRTWGIGQKGTNTGALLIVAPTERKVRIEVGYGLEPVLTDALSSVIIQTAILPKFKAGDLEGGVVAGTDAVIAQLALPDEEAKTKAAQAFKVSQQAERSAGPSPILALLVLFVVIVVLSQVFGRRGRRGGGLGSALPWIILNGMLSGGRGGGGGWSDGGGGGGFSGGGGSFGGGGSSGSW